MRKSLGFTLLLLLLADPAHAGARLLVEGDAQPGLDLRLESATVADRFDVAPDPDQQAALDGLPGVGAAELADAGAPSGPADPTGAQRSDFSLAPGGSQALGMLLIPEPTPAILLVLGLLGLTLAGRKRA